VDAPLNTLVPSPDSNLTETFEVRNGYAFVQLAGRVALEQAAAAVDRAFHAARNRGCLRLLVDAHQLTGFPSPSLAERYFIVRGWAIIANGQVELALVLQPHLIDSDRFGMVVAANAGLRANVFSSQLEALDWLLSGRAFFQNS
jgi:hypothetical protein